MDKKKNAFHGTVDRIQLAFKTVADVCLPITVTSPQGARHRAQQQHANVAVYQGKRAMVEFSMSTLCTSSTSSNPDRFVRARKRSIILKFLNLISRKLNVKLHFFFF